MRCFWKITLGAAFLLMICSFPAHAQQIELACPSGFQPIQGGGATTVNQITGGIRQNICVDINGNLSQAGTGILLCKNIENIRCVDSTNSAGWAGIDVGGWINSAYANLPAAGGKIWVAPNTGNTCYNFSTTISFSVIGKPVQVSALAPNLCLNYTNTGGTSAPITAISETANVVTVTTSLNPVVGTNVTVSGYVDGGTCPTTPAQCLAAYNGTFVVQTASGTQFTYNNNYPATGTQLAAAGAGTAQVTQNAILADWSSVTGGFYPPAGFTDFRFLNNNCGNTFNGCGYATVGINWGRTNGGGEGATMERDTFQGWGVAEQVNNGFSYQIQRFNCVYYSNTFGVQTTAVNEIQDWHGGAFFNNAMGVLLQQTPARFYGVEFDSNTGVSVSSANVGTVAFFAPHFENAGGTSSHYYNGTEDLQINFGDTLDDVSTTTDYYFKGNVVQIYGLRVGKPSGTLTTIASVAQSGELHFSTSVPAVITLAVACPTTTVLICTLNGPSPLNTPPLNLPSLNIEGTASPAIAFINDNTADIGGGASNRPRNIFAGSSINAGTSLQANTFLQLVEAAAGGAQAGVDTCYGDSAIHAVKCSYNNSAFLTLTNVYSSSGVLATGTPHVVQDTATLAAGTITITLTGAAVFTNATSYTCTADDNTAIAATRVLQNSGSSITIQGTGTDVVRYICVGN